MCGHRGLLVNVMFSLTGIFHGSAGGMSSGHTWYQGTPEWSHKIPLGKPGLVIPRCETLASRSVTFPLHQRRVQRWTPSTPSLFLATRICNGGSKGGRGGAAKREVLFTSPHHHHHISKDPQLYPFLYSSCCTWDCFYTAGEQHLQSNENPCTTSLRDHHFRITVTFVHIMSTKPL